MNTMTTYSYSTNEENFFDDFETPEAAANFCFHKYPETNYAFVGVKRPFTALDFVDAYFVLDCIESNAYAECGNAALYWMEKIKADKPKRDEFKKLIGDWLEANAPVNFFAVDDVMEYARPDDGYDDEQ
jgi:hypothetical protein